MRFLIPLVLAGQLVPAGEFSDNSRFTQVAVESAPAELRSQASGRLQFFFIADPLESYTIQIHSSTPQNLHVIVTAASDERRSKEVPDAGVLADDGSLLLAEPQPRIDAVQFRATLSKDTVSLLDRLFGTILLRASLSYSSARPIVMFDGYLLCIQQDKNRACVSSPLEGTAGELVTHVATALLSYAEAPPAKRSALIGDVHSRIERALAHLDNLPAKPPLSE